MKFILNMLTRIKKLIQFSRLVLCLPMFFLPALVNASELSEWEQSCDADNYLDCGAIALTYYHGDDTPVDKNKAMTYFKKSEKLANNLCDKKDKWACHYLAEMYGMIPEFNKTPDEIKTLYVDAIALLDNGCTESNGEDCNELGVIYDDGNASIEKDDDKAIEYYQKSCGLDFSDGCYNLAQLYSRVTHKNDLKAVELYAKAYQLDDMSACAELGTIYMQGRGDIKQDDAKAKTLLTKACDNGNSYGCISLKKLNTVSADKRSLEGVRHTLDSINDAFQGIFSVD